MKIDEISSKEFEKFASIHPQFSFHQTKNWGELKKTMGWDYSFVGLKDKDKIVGGAILLSKETPIKKKIFYSPRGFLIDYSDELLVKEFTKEIKKYVKEHNGFFIKIDPYLEHLERDINGDVVNEGINNSKVIDLLKSIGYKHYGFNLSMGKELQPRWIYVLDLKGKDEDVVFNNFSSDTKRYINRAIKNHLEIEEVDENNLDEFYKIMAHTSKRRGFINRPMSYYRDMLKYLSPNIKILNCFLNVDKALKDTKEEIEHISKEEAELKKIMEETNSKKSKTNYKNAINSLEQLNKKYEELTKLKEEKGSKIVMASSMFLTFGNEVVYLFSGSYDEYMKYNAQYLIQWEIIKYAVNNKYDRYNFYGIDGNLDKENNDTYGIYEFKKGFDGRVVEFIGEFDLVVSKFYYNLYNIAFKMYRGAKHLIVKMKGRK